MHIFALAHIVRRPVLVYAVRIVKSYRGEHLDLARFEGVYLPLLWDPSFCSRSPICLGYTRGHFVALAPMEPAGFRKGLFIYRTSLITLVCLCPGCRAERSTRHAHLPLQDADGKFLPVHFVLESELGHEQQLLCHWLDVARTPQGLWCAKMKLHAQPALVDQMIGQ
jgi:ubiquitin thioesterase ZRANB1